MKSRHASPQRARSRGTQTSLVLNIIIVGKAAAPANRGSSQINVRPNHYARRLEKNTVPRKYTNDASPA